MKKNAIFSLYLVRIFFLILSHFNHRNGVCWNFHYGSTLFKKSSVTWTSHFGIAEGEVSVISASTTSRERVTGVLTFQREPWALLILRQTECKVPFISVNIISMQTGDQKISFFFQSPIFQESYYMRYAQFIALFTSLFNVIFLKCTFVI